MRTIGMLMLVVFMPLLGGADLGQYAKRDPRLAVKPVHKSYDRVSGYTAKALAWEREFMGVYGSGWEILIDLRGGRPARIHGRGIPVLPGLGNTLPYTGEIGAREVEDIARAFLKENRSLFAIDPAELRTGGVVAMDDFWYVNFDRVYKGLPVHGASVDLAISHGNQLRAAARGCVPAFSPSGGGGRG